MKKIRFGLIGSGWRAEFYIRIAKMLPEQFELTGVLIRDKRKGKYIFQKTQCSCSIITGRIGIRNQIISCLQLKEELYQNIYENCLKKEFLRYVKHRQVKILQH